MLKVDESNVSGTSHEQAQLNIQRDSTRRPFQLVNEWMKRVKKGMKEP